MTVVESRSDGIARCPTCGRPLSWLETGEVECLRCHSVFGTEVLVDQ